MQLMTKFIESKEGLTMIRTQVKTSNGWQNKCFVIDTGATISLFSPEVCKTRKICDSIIDLSGNILVSQRCTAILSLAEKDMSIDGHVVDYEIFPKIAGKQVSGLLGVDFFIKNRIILDFDNGEMYQKEACKVAANNLTFVPMKVGIKGFLIPTISLSCNNHELTFIVDTGATSNMITHTIYDMGKKIKDIEPYIMKGLVSSYLAKECELEFQIKMSYAGRLIKHIFLDVFTFIEHGSAISKTSVLNAVHGLIGNDFIHKNKWIIDFAEEKIFRKLE
jgi:hypothetical protein